MQRTNEWIQERIGKFTASEIHRLMSDPKGKAEFSTGAYTYILEKASERLTGISNSSFSNEATDWGHDLEPKARVIYELETGKTVKEVGFIQNPEIPGFGASPDGETEDRGIEIKCPYHTSQALRLYLCQTSEDVFKEKPEYWYQCQSGMLANGLRLWDLVVFEPTLYEKSGLKIITIPFDKEICKKITDRVLKADKKAESIIKSLKQ